jgi:hypothetical protein
MEGNLNCDFFCRLCNNSDIEVILDFGNLALTGVFKEFNDLVELTPLVLVRCKSCGLVQLKHSYDLNILYGNTYGYESHLNNEMTNHLQSTARRLENKYLNSNIKQTVADIASNDGTLLSGYVNPSLKLIGIDPLINSVSDFYPKNSIKIANFFSAKEYFSKNLDKAHLVTSFSVIYDLEDPITFAQEINSILIDDGIWHFEQSYLPAMVKNSGYDTICHEHLLYLTLNDIFQILSKSNFKIIEVSLNDINGGSIAVTAKKTDKNFELPPFAKHLLRMEEREGYKNGEALRKFAEKAELHKIDLLRLIKEYLNLGFKIYGLGASTKGNVILQWLGLSSNEINSIGEINPKKIGKITPGSAIPIIDESVLLENLGANTILFILPWHFRIGILKKTEGYRSKGGIILFPFPNLDIVI